MGREDVLGSDERRTAAAVARRYYLDGKSKVAIAAEFGLSRFKVARLLDLARNSGIVRIEVVEPVEEEMLELQSRVSGRWGLRECWVVPDSATAEQDIGGAAGKLLARLLCPEDVLGLPWSRSVHAMVDSLTVLPRVPIVQLSGAAAMMHVDSSSVDLVRRAARIAGGGCQVFFAPLVMPDEQAAEAVRRDPAVRDTLAAASTVTVAMVGVGAWAPGESTIYDIVDETAREEAVAAGAVGEISAVFFDEQGRLVEPALSQRVIALSGRQLVQIRTVLASCHQLARLSALVPALRGGLVNALVVTVEVAEALLEVE